MELLTEAYNSDLKEIQYELANIRNTIEDTNDFVNIHLNSIRNRIIKMSLFMEENSKLKFVVGYGDTVVAREIATVSQ